MGQPIRWDNVNGPSLAQASQPMAIATQTLNNAFGQIGDVLKQREAIDAANWQNERNNNAAAFNDQVFAKYKTADALNAAIQSGEIDRLKASFGRNIDSNAVRGTADARLAGLQQQASQEIQFQNVMRNEKSAPLVDQLRTALMTGDKQKEAIARQGLADVGYRNMADQDQFAHDWHRKIVTESQADKTHDLNQRLGNSTIAHQRAEEAIGRSNAANQAFMANTQRMDFNFRRQTTEEQMAQAKAAGQAAAGFASLDRNGNLYGKDGIYTGSKAEDLMKYIHDNKLGGDNPSKQAALMSRLADIQKNGIELKSQNGNRILDENNKPVVIRDIPMAAIKQALFSAGDPLNLKPWNINEGPADNFEETLKNLVSKAVVDDKGNFLKSKVLDDLRAYQNMSNNVTENAVPIRSQGSPIVQPRRK